MFSFANTWTLCEWQHIFFCVYLLFSNIIIFVRFTHVIACGCTFSLLYRIPLYDYITISLSILQSRSFELFPDLGHDILEHASWYPYHNIWNSTCGIAGSLAMCIFSYNKYSHTIFTYLHFQQHCIKVSVDFHPLQHLALSNFKLFVYLVGK